MIDPTVSAASSCMLSRSAPADVDRSGLRGIARVDVRDRSTRTPGLAAFEIRARKVNLHVFDLPLGADFYLDAALPSTAPCANAAFSAPDNACAYKRRRNAVICK